MFGHTLADSVLSLEDQQELFSEIYVSAVAFSAGYTVSKPNLDREGVDLEVRAGGTIFPQIGVQLKATYNLGEPVNGAYRFPLKVRNYDLLRRDTLVPRLLVVYQMPREVDQWAVFQSEHLAGC